jgi:hypothetical protein
VTYNIESDVKPYGYDTAAVAALIKEVDVEAADNSVNAAWKRYVGSALLAIATGIVKGDLIAAVFGPETPPSKTFQNSYSIARKAYHQVCDEAGWRSISALPVEDALAETLVAINKHMLALSVTTKNSYDKVCGGPTVIPEQDPNEAVTRPEEQLNETAEPQPDASLFGDDESSESGTIDAKTDDEGKITTNRIIVALEHTPNADLILVASRIIDRIELRQLQKLREDISKKIVALEHRGSSDSSAQAA